MLVFRLSRVLKPVYCTSRIFIRKNYTDTARQTDDSKFRILFLGRDVYSCLVLKELHKAQDIYESITVVAHHDLSLKKTAPVIDTPKKVCQRLNIPFVAVPREQDLFSTWEPPEPFSIPPGETPPRNHLLIAASFNFMLTDPQLNNFRPDLRLNVHPSWVPAFRGPAPIERSMMAGNLKTGISILEMRPKDQQIDGGRVLGRARVTCPKDINFTKVQDILGTEAGKLLVSTLRSLISGGVKRIKQSPAEGSCYAPRITLEDFLVNFNTMTAEEIVWRDRALSHRKLLYTHVPTDKKKELHMRKLAVFKFSGETPEFSSVPGCTIFHYQTKVLLVRCKDDTILAVRKVKQAGKQRMHAGEWWAGRQGAGKVTQVSLGMKDPQ